MKKQPVAPLSPIDDEMVIPAAVRAAAARAEEMHSAVYSAEPEAAPGGEIPAPAGEQLELDINSAGEQPNNAQVPAAQPVETSSAQPSGGQDWERMYNASQGRLQRAEGDLRRMTDRLGEVERLLAATPAPTPAPGNGSVSERLLTPQEESEYGAEFLDVVGRRARELLAPELAKVDARVQELDRHIKANAAVTSMSARDQMHQILDADVHDWRNVNNDPKFLAWLRLPDAFSGVIRHELLTQAYGRNETSRVKAIFNGFLSEEAAAVPPGAEPHQPPAPPAKVPLETLAAPGRAKTAATPPSVPAEKPSFTRAQIVRFYADVSAGKYRGREDDKDLLERQIFEANNEGRVS